MVKRKRVKTSTAAKTKANDKDKAVKSTNSEETSSTNANISGLQERQEGHVDGSPSATKKPKLDSSQSPSANKSKRYVPFFTASQRVSNRLRNRISSEKSEGNSGSQESKIIEGLVGESKDVCKSKQGKGNSQEKSLKETSAMVLQSNEEDADEMPSHVSVNTKQSDVEMKVKNKEEKDSEKYTNEDVPSENMSETTQKQTGIEIQGVESTTNKPEDENTATHQEIRDQGGQDVLQQVLKLSDLTQQSCDKIETNRRSKEKKRMAKNVSPHKSERSKESMVNKFETSTVIVGQMNDVTRLSNIVARVSDFDALGLQTLADTCAVVSAVEHVVSVAKEPGKSDSSQNKLQTEAERETKGMRGERRDNENDNNNNNSQHLAEENIPNKNNYVIPEKQQDAIADVIMSSLSKPTTLCEEGTTDNLVIRTIPSSEIDGRKAQNNVMAMLNETMDTSSSPRPASSQEIIKDKLSEMLSLVTENESNRLPLSQTKSDRNTNATTMIENTDKDGPVEAGVTDTEILSIESADKRKSDGPQERVSNSFVNSHKNSHNLAKTENIEIKQRGMMSVDDECYPAIIEKEEDAGNRQVSADVNCGKNSQKATATVEVTGNKDLSSQETSERVEDFISKSIDFHDQEVPDKVATSPEQEVPDKMVSSPPSRKEKYISVILKNNAETFNHDEVQSSILTSNENSATDISHNESKKVETTEEKVDITTPNNTIDEQSYTEEFKALEELLPRDDMGLFDDVMMSKPINANNELPSGDSTVEFLINELNSLHCMVANYERAVEDMKRPYKSTARF
ncbi:Hypothetical predicted protein [Paramuricea clavata]|uniref:Uncharacterized protein n=1 Tax=Paramuricea clavata TaxID=317549 RepID=A0A6S7H2I9_PARCT|nr:Hypothetical predicted protein [Paramuricea clavata]